MGASNRSGLGVGFVDTAEVREVNGGGFVLIYSASSNVRPFPGTTRKADRAPAAAGQSARTRRRALKLARDHNKTRWIYDLGRYLDWFGVWPTDTLKIW